MSRKLFVGNLPYSVTSERLQEAFSQFGSELDPETQRTLARGERLVKTLNQGERQPMPVADQVAVLYAATNGYLDRINTERVGEFNEGMVERLHSEISDTLKELRGGDWDDSTQKALDEAIQEFASDFGYDLDEEGQPEDQGDDDGGDNGRSGDDGDESGDDNEESREPVGAGSRDE